MCTLIKLKSDSVYEEKASYSRAVSIDNWIYVSNTAGRCPITKAIPADFTEQALQVFKNIEAALSALDATLADVIFSRVYIQDPANISTAVDILGAKFRGIDPATTITCPPLGSAIYKIEIEVTAYKGASAMATDYRRINAIAAQ